MELILGFEKSWVTKENLAINQARFQAWTDAFNKTPLDLLGFGKCCLYALAVTAAYSDMCAVMSQMCESLQ